MIKIFDSSGKVRPISSIKNSLKKNKNQTKNKKTKNKSKNKKEDNKNNLNLLNPMVIPILTLQSEKNKNNDFLNKSIDVILNKPERLTEKWANSLNKWVDSVLKMMELDPPNISEGERYFIGPLVIVKISEANINDSYGTPSIIAADDNGWRYYFKTSKAFSFNINDTIRLKATVSSHKDGITFLRRPSNIELFDKNFFFEKNDNNKEKRLQKVIKILGD